MTIVALVMVILVMLVIGGRWARRGRDYKGKRMQAEALRRYGDDVRNNDQ